MDGMFLLLVDETELIEFNGDGDLVGSSGRSVGASMVELDCGPRAGAGDDGVG